MNCPVCNSEMWDANNSKFPKKEGAPDYRCKDKACKWKLDRDSNEWVESEYVTGVWLPKPPTAKKPAPRPHVATSKPTITEQAKKEMLISYAKDIVCAEIAKGIEVKEPFKRVADGFKVLMMAYAYPFGKPKPVAPPPVPEVDLSEQEEAQMQEPEGDDPEGLPF